MNKIGFKIFDRYPEIFCAISARKDGSMKDHSTIILDNAEKFLSKYDKHIQNSVFMEQVHGKEIKVVQIASEKFVSGVDGLLTSKKNIILSVATADCLPIVFYEPIKDIIGVIHAGFKGILSGIIQEFVKEVERLGGKAENLLVGIGPAIGVCCYSVEKSRIDLFTNTFPGLKDIYQKQGEKYFLDLKKIAVQLMSEYGIGEKNIEVSPYCTYTDNTVFFSYRREGKETYGEFLTTIGMV